MSWDRAQVNWRLWQETLRHRWNQLADEDLVQSGGARRRVVERLQKLYGYEEHQAERELDALLHACFGRRPGGG